MASLIRLGFGILLIVATVLFTFALLLNIASLLQYQPAYSIKDTTIMFPTVALLFLTVFPMLRIQRDMPQRKIWGVLWTIWPSWAKNVYYGLFAYGGVTWLVLFVQQSKTGHIPAPLPFLSIFAMIVCYNAAMLSFALWRDPTLLTGRYCKNGHRVSVLDKFCPECGVAV